MTDQVRDLLARTLPDHEPISLTPQQLLAAGRRRQRRRRAGYLGGGTAAVALVTTGTLLAAPLLGGGTPQPAGPPPDAAATEEAPEPSQPPATRTELSDQIRALFAAELPDLRMSPEDGGGEPLELADPGGGPGNLADLAATAFLTTGQGEPAGWVEVRLYRPGAWSHQPATTRADHHFLEDPPTNPAVVSCWSGRYDVSDDSDPPVATIGIVETRCDTSATAGGGELITVHGEEYYQDRPRSRFSRYWNTVVAFRPDGTAVKAENFCGNAAEDDDETNHCTALRLTIDQLTSIVAAIPTVPD